MQVDQDDCTPTDVAFMYPTMLPTAAEVPFLGLLMKAGNSSVPPRTIIAPYREPVRERALSTIP